MATCGGSAVCVVNPVDSDWNDSEEEREEVDALERAQGS